MPSLIPILEYGELLIKAGSTTLIEYRPFIYYMEGPGYSMLIGGYKQSGGEKGFEPPIPLLPKHGSNLSILILTRLAATLVACCVTKCQEAPIILAQIRPSIYNRSLH